MNDGSYNPSTSNPIYATCAYGDNIKIQRIVREGIRNSLLRCMGKNSHYFCFFIPIVVEVECMDLHHSHYGNRFSIA